MNKPRVLLVDREHGWMDPELDLWVVLLTNRVHPTRDNQKHIPFRRAVHDAAVLSITDQAVSRRVNR